jgi:hypothetical protein
MITLHEEYNSSPSFAFNEITLKIKVPSMYMARRGQRFPRTTMCSLKDHTLFTANACMGKLHKCQFIYYVNKKKTSISKETTTGYKQQRTDLLNPYMS